MPELPEVETTKRGIQPWIHHKEIIEIVVREKRLRWPIPGDIREKLINREIISVQRRAKYLLIETDIGSALIHLGMSGSLRVIKHNEPAGKHDHYDLILNNGMALRYRDPRRFGSLLWAKNPLNHKLLKQLGPEPLEEKFTGSYLHSKAKNRKITIKQFIMNAHIVVGVGNIYASESLYLAGIHPKRMASRISKKRMDSLVSAIKIILQKAIDAGGTTLRDFQNSDGSEGYFKIELNVYDKRNMPCPNCNSAIRLVNIGQRSTYYCKYCQT